MSVKPNQKLFFSANAAADKITSLPGLDKLPAFDMYSGYLNITGTVQSCVNLTVPASSGLDFFRYVRKLMISSLNKLSKIKENLVR